MKVPLHVVICHIYPLKKKKSKRGRKKKKKEREKGKKKKKKGKRKGKRKEKKENSFQPSQRNLIMEKSSLDHFRS